MVTDINLITFKMSGHAQHSGYDCLINYMDCRVISCPRKGNLAQRLIKKSLDGLALKSGITWYNRTSAYSEAVAAWRWFRKTGQVFHFLYGENSYRYAGGLKRIGERNSIICTFHTPPEKFQMLVGNFNHLVNLDAIIVVSNSQHGFFSDLIGDERVFFVPHGVDVTYFQPSRSDHMDMAKSVDFFQCLFVGRHMRDFKSVSEALELLQRIDPSIKFRCVIPYEFYEYFEGLPNVKLLSGISDEDLRGLYQESDLLVLPLIDCTANNTILEAMACGLPVVSTDLEGTRDYLDNSCAALIQKGDIHGIVESVLELKRDRNRRFAMAESIRLKALKFSWENVASQLQEVYQTVNALDR